MALIVGEPAPWFTGATPSNPDFVFDTAAGRYVLLAFLPRDPVQKTEALRQLSANRALFDDARISAFVVVAEDAAAAKLQDMRGLRWFLDPGGAIGRLYGIDDAEGSQQVAWMVLDPTLRVLAFGPMAQASAVMRLLSGLPQPADHAGTRLHAPVLIAPRVFELDLCRRLMSLHDSATAAFTGVMRDIDGRTVAVMDEQKKRKDVLVDDPELQALLRERLTRGLFPELAKSFHFEATRIERYVVSCYDVADGGVFRPHRDNVTLGTAHRRFACSINLNGDFEGGDLRFPEFGRALYRPPVGGAVVFSCSLMHEVTPVTGGRRYAFLPFFHDEAGERVLEAYRRSAAGDAPPAP